MLKSGREEVGEVIKMVIKRDVIEEEKSVGLVVLRSVGWYQMNQNSFLITRYYY